MKVHTKSGKGGRGNPPSWMRSLMPILRFHVAGATHYPAGPSKWVRSRRSPWWQISTMMASWRSLQVRSLSFLAFLTDRYSGRIVPVSVFNHCHNVTDSIRVSDQWCMSIHAFCSLPYIVKARVHPKEGVPTQQCSMHMALRYGTCMPMLICTCTYTCASPHPHMPMPMPMTMSMPMTMICLPRPLPPLQVTRAVMWLHGVRMAVRCGRGMYGRWWRMEHWQQM